MRDLARGLVRDTVLAEDAAQEAWLAALSRPPQTRTSLRAWFAGTLRRVALKTHRTDERRRVREEAAARPEQTASTADVVEAFSTRLAVAEAVRELQEPYRETILLRYYEELSLGEIAKRMETPLPTVAARIQRGIAMLRRRLEERFGGSAAWQIENGYLLEAEAELTALAGQLACDAHEARHAELSAALEDASLIAEWKAAKELGKLERELWKRGSKSRLVKRLARLTKRHCGTQSAALLLEAAQASPFE